MENKYNLASLDPATLDGYISSSMAIIKQFQQPNGAYPASPNFDSYKFCWLRDSSFIAEGMSRAGDIDSAEDFFNWCQGIITSQRTAIPDGNKLEARYTYDGQIADNDWQTYQLDGYGLLLWALKNHCDRHDRQISHWQEMIDLVQIYLTKHYSEPCIDWWEERNGIHAASLSCIYAGLKAFNNPEADNVRNLINMEQERTDGSLIICSILGSIDERESDKLITKINAELVNELGGVYRYADDTYFGGGAWPLLSGLLGLERLNRSDIEGALKEFVFIENLIDENGWLPEQDNLNMLHPDNYDEWVRRVGKPANPLLWSHGMFLWLCSEIKNLI
jgi:GH15 family glucan-1,4-alpha-glucosidase